MWRDEDLFGLFDLSLLESDGLEAWLNQTLKRCSDWFDASGASVFLLDLDGIYRLKAVAGRLIKTPSNATVSLGEGIAGSILLEGQPRIVGDPSRDPTLAGRAVTARSEISSAMIVPVSSPNAERLGVINLSRSSGEPPFGELELEQASKIGDLIGLAVVNARLLSIVQSALDEQNRKSEQLTAVLERVASQVYVFDEKGNVEGQGGVPNPFTAVGTLLIESTLESRESQENPFHDSETDTSWLLHAVPLSQGGGVLTVQDVTKYQQAQDEARRLRRLAEVGQMTAALAHEIRNPLTGIKGAAQLIRSDESFSAEYSRVIEEEAVKLEKLCDDFLDISKPISLRKGPAHLGEIARRVANLWAAEFEQAQVGLVLECDENDPTIHLDVRRVEQITHNLLRNALQACGPGGEVRIDVEEGCLSVRDNGAGMDEQTKSMLFAPFFTTKSDGTGLGLCNVRRIVDAHGGAVDVWTEPGRGTKFEVMFPRSVA